MGFSEIVQFFWIAPTYQYLYPTYVDPQISKQPPSAGTIEVTF